MAKKKRPPKAKASKKKATTKVKPIKTGPSPLVLLLKKIPPRFAINTAIMLLVLSSVALGLTMVDRHVKKLDSFHPSNLVLDLPSWAPPWMVERLRNLPGNVGDCSIYDQGLTRRVRAVYERDPWVRRVVAVQTEFPDKLIASLELRRPAYAVEHHGRYAIVDNAGVALPITRDKWSDPLLMIWGVRTSPPPEGYRWRDSALMGGIETLEAVALRSNLIERLGISGADVSNFNGTISKGESDIDLLAANGCKILWGRPPSTNKPGELSVEEKLQYLEQVLTANPKPKNVEINVRFAHAGGGLLTNRKN